MTGVRHWKKGRGTLGVLEPLVGDWYATAQTQMGHVAVSRRFFWILDKTSLQLDADWMLPEGKRYSELAIFSKAKDNQIAFWSFTSDGKNSHGDLVDATDVHPEAISFIAQMSAGLARMTYWPDERNGMNWAVESKTTKGWNRFMQHSYSRSVG